MKAMKRTIGITLLAVSCMTAWAQDAKTIRMVVPYPPGGGTDTLTRQIAQGMSEYLGQPVVVDNRGGANGQIAGEIVAKAEPDGQTLLVVENAFTVNPHLFKGYPLNPTRDFSAISLMGTAPLILVAHPSVAADNVKDLVEFAKKNPGKLTYASAGNGNPTHISAELFKLATGTNLQQIPYKGSGPAVTDLLGGHVAMMFTGISAVKGFVDKKQLKAMAVTGKTRSAVMPDVPTLAESGVPIPELEQGTWWGVVGPAKLPPEIANKIALAIKKAGEMEAIRAKLRGMSIEPVSNSPQEFTRWIESESIKYGNLVTRAKIDTN